MKRTAIRVKNTFRNTIIVSIYCSYVKKRRNFELKETRHKC